MSRLKQYLNTGNEEFVEGVDDQVIDEPAPQEEWVNLPDPALGEVHDGVETEGALNTLADKVEGTEEEASLEAYDFSFRAICAVANFAPQTFASLEDFKGPLKQRSELARSIRSHASGLTHAINASLEDYQDVFDTNLKTTLSSIKQSAGALKSAAGDITINSARPKKMNHSKIWQMMHINGSFISDLAAAIREEKSGLDKLLRAVASGTDDGEMSAVSASLMFNTNAEVRNNRVTFEQIAAPAPKVKPGEAAQKGSGSRWRWTIAGLLFFNLPGALVGYLIGNAKDTARAERAGTKTTTEEVSARQIAEVKEFLNGIAALEGYVAQIEKLAVEIGRQIETEDKESRKALRRKFFPVMDGLELIAKHIAELMYGGAKVAEAAGSAS